MRETCKPHNEFLMTESTKTQKAIWTPSWYEMDQSLSVGIKQKFWFFQDKPSQIVDEEVDYVFFNQLDSEVNSVVRFAEIVEIYHETLGTLARVDTDGLDYIFVPIEGSEIFVNAEEEPGNAYDSEFEIEDWTLLVTLQNVSEPICDAV